MRLRWVHASRLPRPHLWAVGVVAVWSGALASVHAVAARAGTAAPTCLLHHVVGIPCPTCGATRGALAILAGRPLAAFALNPLLFAVLLATAAALLARLAAGRRVDVSLSPRERRAAIGIGIALVLVDWAYLIASGA